MSRKTDRKVGFIGLGNMGKPMAINLAKAGVALTVYDRDAAPLRDLEALGAHAASSAREVGERSEIVEIVVMTDRQVEEVVLGKGQGEGLLAGMSPGSIIVIHSTVHPDTCKRMAKVAAERQVGVIDAAVSGAEARSKEGTLTLMVGGDPELVERCRPVFSIVGRDVFHMGDVGMGQVTKLCNNLMSLVNLQVVEEALSLARGAGIDEGRMMEIAKLSTGDSWALRSVLPMRELISRASHGAGSTARMGGKDLELALSVGQSLGVPLDFTEFAIRRAREGRPGQIA